MILVREREFYFRAAKIALPIAAQSLITMGVNMVDNIMVGSLGEVGLSATSLANQFISLYQISCMGLGMGAAVLTSRYWGMREISSLKKAVTIMLRFCILFATLFAVATIFIPDSIMRCYTPEPDVIAEGVRYLNWSIPSYWLLGLSLTTTIVLRTVGCVQVPLYTSMVTFAINIFFNYVFIFGHFGAPRMGVAGAAIGTLIARVVEFVFICGYFFVIDQRIAYRIKDLFSRSREMLSEYVRISMPVLVSDVLLAFGNTAVAIVMGHIGAVFVAANAITMVVQQLSTVFIQGCSQASCIVIGHTLGSGNRERVQLEGRTFLIVGTIVGAFAGGLIVLFGPMIVGLYDISAETATLANQLMRAVGIIVIFQSANSILTKGVLRGGGDTKFLMLADILFLWIVSIPLGAIAGLVWHLPAFWVYGALKIDQIIKAIWCVFRLESKKWIKSIRAVDQNQS